MKRMMMVAVAGLVLTHGSLCMAEAQGPRVFVMDGPTLVKVRDAVQAGDDRFAEAAERLKRSADRALDAGPFTVTDKTGQPPSGDPHDYMSIGIYWWPNPDTEDGLPYVRRDGEVNPESDDGTFDARRNPDMVNAVNHLAPAYYLTGEEAYAERAAMLLRTWFVDPDTRMNPNLRYAQAWPGRNDGQGFGIIETVIYINLVDAPGLIAASDAWSDEDQRELQQWFAAYLDWLKTSPNGRFAQGQPQNHGTWYDAQVLAYALFSDQPELARQHLDEWTKHRIEHQLDERGAQHRELRRTRTWSYSNYNLSAWVKVARLAEHLDVDIWRHETDDGRSIQTAIDFLLPYLQAPDDWPYPQMGSVGPGSLATLILPLAAVAYDEPRYWEALAPLIGRTDAHLNRLRHARYVFERPNDPPGE